MSELKTWVIHQLWVSYTPAICELYGNFIYGHNLSCEWVIHQLCPVGESSNLRDYVWPRSAKWRHPWPCQEAKRAAAIRVSPDRKSPIKKIWNIKIVGDNKLSLRVTLIQSYFYLRHSNPMTYMTSCLTSSSQQPCDLTITLSAAGVGDRQLDRSIAFILTDKSLVKLLQLFVRDAPWRPPPPVRGVSRYSDSYLYFYSAYRNV